MSAVLLTLSSWTNLSHFFERSKKSASSVCCGKAGRDVTLILTRNLSVCSAHCKSPRKFCPVRQLRGRFFRHTAKIPRNRGHSDWSNPRIRRFVPAENFQSRQRCRNVFDGVLHRHGSVRHSIKNGPRPKFKAKQGPQPRRMIALAGRVLVNQRTDGRFAKQAAIQTTGAEQDVV